MASDRHSWDGVWPSVTAEIPAIRYDLRGFGQSSAADTPYDHTDDLLKLIDNARIDRADLIGVSMGGAIAISLALARPDRVRRLFLISPALYGWTWSDEWKAQWRKSSIPARAGIMDEARQQWLQHPMFQAAMEGPHAAELTASAQDYHGQQWIADPQRPVFPDAERLHELEAPTLLLTGGRDFQDFRLIADVIQQSCPSVRRVDQPASGHMVHLEDRQSTASLMRDFLKR